MQRNKQLQFMMPDTSPGGPRSDVLCLILISVPLVYNTARLGLESHVKVSACRGMIKGCQQSWIRVYLPHVSAFPCSETLL